MYPRTLLRIGFLALLISSSALAEKPQTLVRDEIPDALKWDLTPIFADWNAWDNAVEEVREGIATFPDYSGTLDEGPEHLAKVLKERDRIGLLAEHVRVYTFLKITEDARRNDIQARQRQAAQLGSELSEATAWVVPEMLEIPSDKLSEWADSDALADYSFPIHELIRKQAHVLDAEGEQMLALAEPLTNTPEQIYQMLSIADAQFKPITLSDGSEVIPTAGNYGFILRTSKNQADRRAITKAHYSVYDASANSFASIALGSFQAHWFSARARNYRSVLEMSLDRNGIPGDVYATLIETARKGVEPLRKYQALRKKAMKLDSYSYYDAYLPLVEVNESFPYERAQEMVLRAIEPLGEDYVNNATIALTNRWIDVYENEGKESGAFSQGVFAVHPYIKLNYTDTMNDMFTLSHELGHAMHSVYSSGEQPLPTAYYATFVAEVASTMNEMLLMDEMLETTEDPMMRIALLQSSIDDISAAFYRQTMFAEWELGAHEMVENGTPVTADALQKLYLDDLRGYFGDSLDDQELYKNTWAYISHFYVLPPYYVFQYATSLAAVSKLHHDLTTGSKKSRRDATRRYISLLKSGGSDNPVELLREAGVDMTDPDTYQAVVDEMSHRVKLLEKELKKLEML